MSQTAARPRLALLWTYLFCVMATDLFRPPSAAAGDSSSAAIERHAPPGFIVGLKAGLGTGKPINEFGLQYAFELELGYLLPLPDPLLHSLELFVSLGYVGSSLSGQTAQRDARLPGNGRVSYSLSEQSVPMGGGLRFRVPLPSQRFAPYLAAGYRAFGTADKIHTKVAGRSVSDNTERSLHHGFFASAGLELFIGPGAAFAELQLSRASRDELVVRDAVGGIQGFLGYRLMFGGPAKSEPVKRAPAAKSPPPVAAAPAPPPPTAAMTPETPPPAEVAETHDNQIRGVVRSFDGQPVQARVSVEPGALTSTTGADGKFSLDVPPGRYSVTLQAHGYRSQTKACVVDPGGITVLNVELRDE
ncbi:MAG TPA: carboxypeptidase-like regulatory domain-containing protein [Polyangiales bacterium]|nr:carboxypeptidase-like regulatory domain-containing protein [Polyangiales bacterium]